MDFKDCEDERTKLNNEIIVPAYRQFCRENDLAFNFWDELPKEQFNPKVAIEEHELHKEAMNCFNNLKPKFVFFNNKIYTYHFTDWGGEFDFQSWQIDDFLNQAHEQVNTTDGLQKQIDSALSILGIITTLFLIGLIGFILHLLHAPGELFFVGLIVATAIIFFLRKKFFKKPLKKYNYEISQYKIRLENLKKKFDSSNNTSAVESKLFDKAKELVDCSRVLVGIIRPSLLTRHPDIYLSKELDKLNIYGTIAFTSIVCTYLHQEVKTELRTPLEEIVQEKLKELYPTALTDYANLNSYIKDNIMTESDRGKRLFYIHKLATIWILIKIGFVEDFRNPSSKALKIAEDIAKQFQNESRGYWTIK